jgi:hypothetical protein
MYNPNSPSNWSWSKAFAEMEKTVNEAEMTQQVINHLHGYKAEGKFLELSKKKQEQMYEILTQIL